MNNENELEPDKKGFWDLKVFQKAFDMAMEIFNTSKAFPSEEKYSLTDQIRRSSRSICSNISEAYRKKRYPAHFISKLTDADAECSETAVWLKFALTCNYIENKKFEELESKIAEIGRMLGAMINNSERFALGSK
jgi:four helix bundle protein